MIKKTKHESYKIGRVSKACKQCAKGKKSVFFITGLCPRRCNYCPLSDDKKNSDVTFINEWETRNEREVIKEIKLCKSRGVGITGGDPLVSFARTTKFIKLLKKTFGRRFHVHLYTTLSLIDDEKLTKLFNAGLDEIRFHPDLNKEREWEKIGIASKYKWKVTLEIPAIPKKYSQIKKLIETTAEWIDYLNINELELADNSFSTLGRDYEAKNELSYAVKGSQNTAYHIMRHAAKLGVKNIHYCTATLKDKYQLANRIKKRGKSIKKSFDKLTKEGMIVRAAIYHKPFVIHQKPSKDTLQKIDEISDFLISLGVKEKKVYLDKDFGRVLTSSKIAIKYAEALKDKKWHVYIVEEYPTKDAFPIEITKL
ncbi:radical SAM protein [Candidatus Woesearchaeota archaeon]|nr:radical SAM protein [Candidatus Woesearchaeota archaeon]